MVIPNGTGQLAESLVREAFAKGARWVILPEFFTSAMAVHQKMLDAARPVDGKRTQQKIEIEFAALRR